MQHSIKMEHYCISLNYVCKVQNGEASVVQVRYEAVRTPPPTHLGVYVQPLYRMLIPLLTAQTLPGSTYQQCFNPTFSPVLHPGMPDTVRIPTRMSSKPVGQVVPIYSPASYDQPSQSDSGQEPSGSVQMST